MKAKKREEIIPRVVDTTQRRIILNVGGQRHETYMSTIKNYPDTRLYWVVENVTKAIDYDLEKIELFFDRHPDIFGQILNYYRTGKLHCPHDVCGPLFEEELAYWGIDEKEMEHCCWTSYTQHRDAEHNLKSFNVHEYEQEKEDQDTERDKPEEPTGSQHCHKISWWGRYQPKIWPILEEPHSSKFAKIFSILSVTLILLSVGTSCAGTLPQFSADEPDGERNGTTVSQTQPAFFTVVDNFCGIWFSLELLLRVVFCPNKWTFFKQPMNWIDALSVLPFYLRLMVPAEKVLVDALLVFRLLRLFRFFRLLYGLQVLLHTLKACSYELGLLLLILFIPVILFSAVIYYVERSMDSHQTKFRSIPESFWWSLITMTTVGYGDMTPKTWLGRIFGGACAICGVLVVALPISIIGSSFNLYYAYAQARLKLPRKKNRILFNSLAMELPSRDTAFPSRRGAVRRRSPGTSGSEDCTPPASQRTSGQGRLSGFVKSPSHEARNSCTWSVNSQRSSGGEYTNDVKTSPKAKRKLSRERKVSRSERSPPKLDDLPERDEIEELNQRNDALTFNLSQQSFGDSPTVSQEELSPWIATNGGTPRVRSYSVPSQPPRTFSLRPPRKSRSDSSNLCKRCLLPKKEGATERQVDTTPLCEDETCQCLHGTLGQPLSHSPTFTVFIPGVRENIQVSSDSLPSFGMELPLSGISPIQLDIVRERGRRCSGISHQDEQETITSDLDSDVEVDFRPRPSSMSTLDGGTSVPMVYIDMPRTEREMTGISGTETQI